MRIQKKVEEKSNGEKVYTCLYDSSVVFKSTYDCETQLLSVTFSTGLVYEYYDVTIEDYIILEGSNSQGSILTKIFKSKYKYAKKEYVMVNDIMKDIIKVKIGINDDN